MKMNPRPHGPIINVPGRVTEEEMKKVFEGSGDLLSPLSTPLCALVDSVVLSSVR